MARKPHYAVVIFFTVTSMCRRAGRGSDTRRSTPRVPGGGGGIRTHETVTRLPVFKTGAFNHSATPPRTCEMSRLLFRCQDITADYAAAANHMAGISRKTLFRAQVRRKAGAADAEDERLAGIPDSAVRKRRDIFTNTSARKVSIKAIAQ